MKRDQKNKEVTLHEPERAVNTYLEALLSEIDESPNVVTEPKVEVKTEVKAEVQTPAKVKAKRATVVKIRPTVDTTLEQAVEIQKTADIPEKVTSQRVQTEVEAPSVVANNEEVVPEWANTPFQTLFFVVRGMTLGIPLVELNSIAESNYELTSLPGQPDWHLGVAVHREQRIVVVDTAQLIAPERLAPASEVRKQGSHILVVGDGQWGLACDSIKSPQLLERDSVRWRRGAGWQPWMAGTVIDQLCILLDIDALLEMLGHK